MNSHFSLRFRSFLFKYFCEFEVRIVVAKTAMVLLSHCKTPSKIAAWVSWNFTIKNRKSFDGNNFNNPFLFQTSQKTAPYGNLLLRGGYHTIPTIVIRIEYFIFHFAFLMILSLELVNILFFIWPFLETFLFT